MTVSFTPALANGQGWTWWNTIDHGAPVATDPPSTQWLSSPPAPMPAPKGTLPNATSSADKLTLEAAVQRGLADNPAVRAALADVKSASTEVDIAEWGYFPEVDLSAGPEELPFSEFGYDASARQTLYDWGRIDSRVESANASEREARQALEVAVEEAALDIADVYLDALAAKRRLELAQTYVDDLEKLARLTWDRGSSGYTDRSEQGRIALDLAQARDELATERGELNDARHQFRVLVGVAPLDLELPDPVALTDRLDDDATLNEWIVHAPAYRQTVAVADQAQAELEESRATLKPQLNLEGSLQRRQIGGDLQSDSVIGLRLRMDTLQGLANFHRPEAARQRLEVARYRIDDQRREIRRSVLTLIENTEVYRQRQQALKEQVQQAQAVSELYTEQFSVALRDINDLLTIRQEEFSARRQLIDIAIQQKRMQYRAASQLGLIKPLIAGSLRKETP